MAYPYLDAVPTSYLSFIPPLPVVLQTNTPVLLGGGQRAHLLQPCKRRRSRLCICSTLQPQNTSTVWERVRSAVPLSRAFADYLGEDALHHVSEHKYKVVCPFHNDRNPSLHINDSLNLFHCFGCGAKGDIVNFEQLISGHRSLSTALKSLAGKYQAIGNILQISPSATVPSTKRSSEPVPRNLVKSPVQVPLRVRLTQAAVARDVLRKLTSVYEACLWDEHTSEGLYYLQDTRRISRATLRIFGCGFAPPSPRADFSLRILNDSGFPPEHAVLAGVARALGEGTDGRAPKFREVFQNRIVTPIRDLQGETVALAGRVLPGASTREAKYINSPTTVLFKKQNFLFGADLAKRAPSAKADCGYVIVLEGYLDVLSLFDHTQGRVACVAAMGTALSSEQLNIAYDLLGDEVDGRVIINFDGDDAGKKAVERLCNSVIPEVFGAAHSVYIAEPPPPVKDADEFLSTAGSADEYVTYLLESAMPWYEWQGNRIVQNEVERLKGSEDIEANTLTEPNNQNELSWQSLHTTFGLGDEMRRQRNDMMVAFGAPPESLYREPEKVKTHPRCSEEVLNQLAEVVNKAHRVLPGLNVPALAQSWADLLSRSELSELSWVYQQLMDRIRDLCKPWAHLTVESQIYWLPPPPWLLEELSPERRNAISETGGYLSDEASDEDIERFLTNKMRAKRSLEKITYQSEKVLPLLQQGQCEEVKRLKIVPRRCAEEIILRSVIFASETDRIDAVSEVLDVNIRCQKKGLPFWTSDKRMQLFEFLATLEGPVASQEIAAYVEEFEWFSADIGELFVPLEEVTDNEWRAIRAMEMKSPVKAAKSAAFSVEEMSRRVKSSDAIDKVESNMTELLALKTATSGVEGEAAEQEGSKIELLARHAALRKQIDQTDFMSEGEFEKAQKEVEKTTNAMKREVDKNELLNKLRRHEKIEFLDAVPEVEDTSGGDGGFDEALNTGAGYPTPS